MLPRDVPVAEPMRVDEVLGYLNTHLERGYEGARIDRRQSFQLVQPFVEDMEALSECNIHLLLAPPTHPVSPCVG